jgi:hypothetical protein
MKLTTFLIELWRNEDGFFGVNMGPSQGEYGATNALTGQSGFAGSVGQGLVSGSSGILNAILSGNQAEISKLLAPQIGSISKQANEATQTRAQFGTRSGGTNAANQNVMDTSRSSINDMISQLTSGAIGQASSLGSNLLNTSQKGYEDVFSQNQIEQQQRLAKFNDIINSSAQAASMGVGAAAGVGATPSGTSTGGQWLAGLQGAGF